MRQIKASTFAHMYNSVSHNTFKLTSDDAFYSIEGFSSAPRQAITTIRYEVHGEIHETA